MLAAGAGPVDMPSTVPFKREAKRPQLKPPLRVASASARSSPDRNQRPGVAEKGGEQAWRLPGTTSASRGCHGLWRRTSRPRRSRACWQTRSPTRLEPFPSGYGMEAVKETTVSA